MATVAAPLTVEDLEARYRGASHTIEKSHFQAVWLLAKGRRPRAETAMFRYKTLIGRRLRARTLPGRKAEARTGCAVINGMTHLGMPVSCRVA